LASGQSRLIGIVIGHGADIAFSNPLLGEVLKGIGQTVAARGYQVMLLTQDGHSSIENLVHNQQLDGLLFMSVTLDNPLIPALSQTGFPIILTCKHTAPEISYIDVDNKKGAFLATQHLIALGHTNIGFINGPSNHGSCQDRLIGYCEALEQAGLRSNDTIVEGDFSEESGFRKAFALLEARRTVTAIFAASDLMAIGAIRAIQEAGLSVPNDVSVIGFDGIPLARYLSPPLSTVQQTAVEKGKLAAEMLLERLKGERTGSHQILLEPELVVRSTTSRVRLAVQP
jgi:DNA-binding LacI/PurR family transcriptional regulator